MTNIDTAKNIDNVVYILGAGFSAPLHLPVMSNFLDKSKDMFSLYPDKYKHFLSVFKTINKMHKSKSYFDTNLFNIEEILSILEMSEEVESATERSFFIDYIIDVIEHYTPSMEYEGYKPLIHGGSNTNYGMFVGNLLNIAISSNSQKEVFCNRLSSSHWPASYSVITLNYDMVLENCFNYLAENLNADKSIGFSNEIEKENIEFKKHTHLAKLHGSIHTKTIVPPTWNKGLNKNIKPAWQLAYKLLTEANQIRIIGYSLPTTDAYVKYLLKAAIINSESLKKIDVICRDDEKHSVEKRYKEFIHYPNYTFNEGSIEAYMRIISSQPYDVGNGVRHFNQLENAHNVFFDRR